MIALVIGHSSDAPGATNPSRGVSEYEWMKPFARMVQDAAESDTVVFERPPNAECGTTTKALYNVVEALHEASPSAIVSLHANAATVYATGTQTMYYPSSRDGRRLAKTLQDRVTSVLGLPDRGVHAQDDLIILRDTPGPAVMMELFFIDNTNDLDRATAYKEPLARSVARGIDAYVAEESAYV